MTPDRARRYLAVIACTLGASATATLGAGTGFATDGVSAFRRTQGRLTPARVAHEAASRQEPPASVTKPANPVPYTRDSIARGKTTYLRECQSCHDEDGRALTKVVANATDLTQPDTWTYGTADAEIFSSIKNGAGDSMPPFKSDLKDDQVWDLANFIRSIGPESRRPRLPGEER